MMQNTTASTQVPSLSNLLATAERLAPPPREVFLFKGNAERFGELLGEPGLVVDRGCLLLDKQHAMRPIVPPFGCLEVHEIHGWVWIGANIRDIEDACSGRIPVKVIAGS